MAIWWMTEALPIAVTALLPLILFPVLGIADLDATAAPYANPLIFLFLGGFILAQGLQRWGVHRRIALGVVARVGTRPGGLIAGFMLASALLSMWVSNTATALMMLPIGRSVAELSDGPAEAGMPARRSFAVALMLGIAYACSIGGLGTLIGTPPNTLLAAFMAETYGRPIDFARWMLVGVPVVATGLPLAFLVLTRLVFPLRLASLPGGRALVEQERRRQGPMRLPERLVLAVFILTALLWMTRPLLAAYVPGLSDTGIAIFGAVLLFVLPVDRSGRRFLLNWRDAEALPWGVLLLFGGGLTLAAAINDTGLATWIGAALEGIGTWPRPLVVLMMTLVVILLTELTSNTATAAAFLPVVASVAVGLGEDPLRFAVPAALAASCAFMLPVATPPNAIVYGSGLLSMPQMARAGLVLNLLFTFLITVLALLLVPRVFGPGA
ncbi:MAG: di- and tricarboxylate transporter [Rhodothermaceae bacterium]|nr:MAG: di- and tricarboxylate transporter [Rhodothermaceae bacterium]